MSSTRRICCKLVINSGLRRRAAPAARFAAPASTLGGRFADYADGEFHVLKADLLPDDADEVFGHRVGRDGAVELEADGFAGEVRKGVGQFAIEREAEVGVYFFLKLKEPLLGAVPRAGLDHDEDGFAGLTVKGEGVETAGIFDAESVSLLGIRAGFGCWVLAAGVAHSAKEWTSTGGLSKTGRMKAICVRAFGGPEVLELATVPDPQPGPGQVLVRLMAAGVNPVETYIRSGSYGRLPDLPYTPGSDGAGVISAVGADVPAHLQIGERVWVAGSLSGTYAEAALCQAGRVFHLPEQVSFAEGAALGIPYTTAYRALFQRGGAKPNETVLVHGATGGVGLAAVQFARAAGMRVLATGGTESGRAMLREQGATEIFDHTAGTSAGDILKATGGHGVDLIVEMLANENLSRDLTMLAPSGRIVVVGSRGPVELNPRDAMIREADIRGVLLLNASASDLLECQTAIGAGLETGALAPVIGREFKLDDAGQAHEAVMAAGHRGKVILHCANSK